MANNLAVHGSTLIVSDPGLGASCANRPTRFVQDTPLVGGQTTERGHRVGADPEGDPGGPDPFSFFLLGTPTPKGGKTSHVCIYKQITF